MGHEANQGPENDSGHEPQGKGEESAPGSITSKNLGPNDDDSRVNDASIDELPPPQLVRPASQQSVEQAQNRAVARVVAEKLRDLKLGQYLPDSMAGARKERIMKAEALWRSGILSPDEIAKTVGVTTKTTIYAWASEFYWPKRADIAKLGQEALFAANVAAIAVKAQDAEARLAAASAMSAEDPAKPANEISAAEGVIDLASERAQRPMSEADQERASMLASAAAGAHQDTILQLFVETISKLVKQQQDATNDAVEFGVEMLRDLRLAYRSEKELRGKNCTPKELRDEVTKSLAPYRQLVAALTQAIALQRRVWMISDPKGSSSFGDDTLPEPWDGGLERVAGGPGVPAPVMRGTYEESIIAADRAGIDLTRR